MVNPATLETRQLQLVAAIAETRNLTRAAADLGLTQPAVSHNLRSLERQVGVTLFVRGRRTVYPTEAGERILKTARVVLRELNLLSRDVRERALGRSELIRLSTECYTAYHWLPAVLTDATRELSAVELRVVPSATGDPLVALQQDVIDLGITARPPASAGFEFHPLFEDDLVVILDPDHPKRHLPFFGAQDFADEHLLRYTEFPHDTTVIREVLSPAGVTARQDSYVPAVEALVEMVGAGIGIAVIARWAVAPMLEQQALVSIPLTRSGWPRTWSAVVRHEGVAPASLRALIQLLRRHAPQFTRPVRRHRAASRVRG